MRWRRSDNRPGFTETLRQGWGPRRQRTARSAALASAETAPNAPAARGKRKGRRAKAQGDGGSLLGQPVGQHELIKQRNDLSKQFAELQWDLGGIAYEMASRDQFRREVLSKQAAKLQEVDSQLGQIERMLKLGEAGAAGTCPSCGALQARGAMFCWKCGKELRPKAKASGTTKAAPRGKSAPKAAPKSSRSKGKS
jgi:ribosomal protein L40E